MSLKDVPTGLLELFLHHVPTGILVINQQGYVVTINPAARRLLGLPDASLDPPADHIPGSPSAPSSTTPSHPHINDIAWVLDSAELSDQTCDCSWPWDRLLNSADSEDKLQTTLCVIDSWQRRRFLRCFGVVAHTGDSSAERQVALALEDVTEYKAAEQERSALMEFIEVLPDFVGLADTQGNLLYHNRALREAQGEGGEVQSINSRISDAHDPESLELLRKEGFPVAERDGIWRGQTWLRHVGKETEIPVDQVVIAHRDAQGKVKRYSTLMHNLSVERARESEIERLLYRDPVTGLPNRMLFHDRVEQARLVQNRGDEFLAVIVCDIRDFSAINESLGQEGGDQVLAEVGRRLQANLPQEATIGRLGGDLFGILLPRLEEGKEAVEFAERIVSKVGDRVLFAEQAVHLNLRAGISVTSRSGESARTLVDQADAARRASKRSGVKYQFYSSSITEQAREHVYLTTELRHALDNNDLQVYYQPQVDFVSGKLIGFEALVRWQHPQEGWIGPGRFIPVAESSGLIGRVGEQVIDLAARDFLQARRAGFAEGRLAINIAAPQMNRPNWAIKLLEGWQRNGLAATDLELEITERLFVRSRHSLIEQLQYLRSCGVKIAVDDFGTGYSSLNYLKDLPVDRIKIDQSFITDLPGDHRTETIIKAITTLAKGLGMEVLAEGVETAGQAQALGSAGCYQGQGHLFARPAPAASLWTGPQLECWRVGNMAGAGAEESRIQSASPGPEEVAGQKTWAKLRGERERRYRLAQEAARFGIWEWDLEADAIDWDNVCWWMLGYSAEMVGSMSYDEWRAIIHPEDIENVESHIQYALTNDTPYLIEMRCRSAFGDWIWVQERGQVVSRADDGQPLLIAGANIDFGQCKKTEADIQRQLEQANDTRSTFLNAVSHELRTPLNALMGFADLLSDSSLSAEKREFYAARSRDAGERLLHKISSILDLSQLKSGGVELHCDRLELRSLVYETCSPFLEKAQNKRLSLSWQVAEEVPTWVEGDGYRISQLLNCLLENAIEHSERGRILVEVSQHNPQQLLFAVHDNGPGISPEVQEELFAAFDKGSYADEGQRGRGLGLLVAYELARQLGGALWLNSVSEVGSTFCFTAQLPAIAAPVENDEAFAHGNNLEEDVQLLCGEGVRVLIAEDDPVSALLIQTLLQNLGCDTTLTGNGQEALDTWQQHPFDLLFLDLRMPLLSGLDVVRAVRSKETDESLPYTPAVLCTAQALDEVEQESFQAGFDKYTTKPVNVHKLKEIIRWLRHIRAWQATV